MLAGNYDRKSFDAACHAYLVIGKIKYRKKEKIFR